MLYFNKPYLTGNEIKYIQEAIIKQTSGNGFFTNKCHQYFQEKYGFKKVLLTTSCTDALEMAAILINIHPGDEVIIPSYTYVSTANPFVLRGAKIVFADSSPNHPNIDVDSIELLISPRTKALVIVHYAGMACNMDKLNKIVEKYNIFLIEDAAQAINSYYKNRPLGTFGNLSCFSFHETKNITSGEGGLLVINDEKLLKRAEIIWDKGTTRASFLRGEIDKYTWVDVGSSYSPSEMIAAFLLAQLESLMDIQKRRNYLWEKYYCNLQSYSNNDSFGLPQIPKYATHNAHIFYITCKNASTRNNLIHFLKEKNIQASFHYLSLHKSKFYSERHDCRILVNADFYTNCLLRLPLYIELTDQEINFVTDSIIEYYSLSN
ncbi:dTDP-4-amino-4,6-dideoxygalactose transaminase [Rhodocytophaga aerolata]|uniref:dTDP-4-amino-4,6-dideoxygalactose transaminase n=2 Tax=Rhodocytophaga aerolata TaxID=455078 RepID=A0ABT8RFT8_9BACT|nr:dTDP-4-amino-4,6-dideoxygalactose transaminase [Rhodocytophaga aerolata]MDO1450977.1 dTDP-4-amino-4,6-dideoxygalactose transaminase [Rhodocytophaga aerolata]